MLVDDAWRAVLELAAAQYGAFNRLQAAERSLSRPRLRRAVSRGELEQPLPNVFVLTSSTPTWRRSLMTYSLAGGAASHRAAAALHGLDGFGPGVVEITMRRECEVVLPGAICHRFRRLTASHIVQIDGIRCTNRALTLAQLGAVCSDRKVEQALDSALLTGTSVHWVEEVLAEVWRPGPSGVGALRRVLEDPRRNGRVAESFFERRLARLLTDRGLPPPVLQHELRLPGGTRRPDLAYPHIKLGIEAHSKRHHLSVASFETDTERDLEVAAAGWDLLYVTWSMMKQPDHLADQIATIYRARHDGQAQGSRATV